MRKVGVVFVIVLAITLVVIDGIALMSTASAAPVLYSAGVNVYRDGQVTGCRCPLLVGECTCEWAPPQK